MNGKTTTEPHLQESTVLPCLLVGQLRPNRNVFECFEKRLYPRQLGALIQAMLGSHSARRGLRDILILMYIMMPDLRYWRRTT